MKRPSLFCISIPIIWTLMTERADPLFRFEREDGKAGFIDKAGREVVEPATPAGERYFEGKASRGLNGFSEGLVADRDEKVGMWGYRDKNGAWAIPPRFRDYASAFSEGLAMVEHDEWAGYVNRNGAWMLPPVFAAARPFRDGLARVVTDGPCVTSGDPDSLNPCTAMSMPILLKRHYKPGAGLPFCKWQFIDRSGQPAVPGAYHQARDFREGLAAVATGPRQWGYIDRQGRMTIPARFSQAHSFSGGLALVEEAGRAGFIDPSGQFRIDVARIQDAESFSHGLAAIGNEKDGFVYIDTKGGQAFPERFAIASPFFHGLAHVKRVDGSFAYIDPDGRAVFSYRP